VFCVFLSALFSAAFTDKKPLSRRSLRVSQGNQLIAIFNRNDHA
jgi:hypothetical protein